MAAKIIEGAYVAEETTALSELVIAEGASITAPEGKYVTLTVNGRVTMIKPGTYTGDVVLTVADEFRWQTYRFGNTEMNGFHAGIVVKDGKYLPEYSVPAAVQGGEIGDGWASGQFVNARDWDFGGFYVTGKGDYTISDVTMNLLGDGTDDFCGKGAGIAVSGDVKLTVNNAEIHSHGISRGACFVGENAEVTFNDCFFTLDSGVYTAAELEERKAGDAFRMMSPPWGMGIAGHGRTTNLAGMATANYNNCYIKSNSWGCLSIDGGCVTRLNVKDSVLELTGTSGYGVFSICDDVAFDYAAYGKHGSYDVVDHSVIKGVTYPIIMSLGKAGGAFINGTEIYSRFGCLIFRNSGGHLDVNSGAVINTELDSFLVKGANAYITVDNATLNTANGTILNLMDNDETGMAGDPFMVPHGVVDTYVEGRDLTVAVPTEDVFLSLSNMEVNGSIYNGTTNTFPMMVPDPDAPKPDNDLPVPDFGQVRGMGPDLQGAKNLEVTLTNAKVNGLITASRAAYPDGLDRITGDNYLELSVVTHTAYEPINNGVIVSVDKDTVWTVPGTCYLTSLTVEDGAVIQAAEGKALTFTVDGAATELKAGKYTGKLALVIA